MAKIVLRTSPSLSLPAAETIVATIARLNAAASVISPANGKMEGFLPASRRRELTPTLYPHAGDLRGALVVLGAELVGKP